MWGRTQLLPHPRPPLGWECPNLRVKLYTTWKKKWSTRCQDNAIAKPKRKRKKRVWNAKSCMICMGLVTYKISSNKLFKARRKKRGLGFRVFGKKRDLGFRVFGKNRELGFRVFGKNRDLGLRVLGGRRETWGFRVLGKKRDLGF